MPECRPDESSLRRRSATESRCEGSSATSGLLLNGGDGELVIEVEVGLLLFVVDVVVVVVVAEVGDVRDNDLSSMRLMAGNELSPLTLMNPV